MRIQTYGGVPVPYTVSWSAEESFHVAHCPHGRGIAICRILNLANSELIFIRDKLCEVFPPASGGGAAG